ncbi:hypothetical protein ACQJBY_008810 [Aegilops geniculata]
MISPSQPRRSISLPAPPPVLPSHDHPEHFLPRGGAPPPTTSHPVVAPPPQPPPRARRAHPQPPPTTRRCARPVHLPPRGVAAHHRSRPHPRQHTSLLRLHPMPRAAAPMNPAALDQPLVLLLPPAGPTARGDKSELHCTPAFNSPALPPASASATPGPPHLADGTDAVQFTTSSGSPPLRPSLKFASDLAALCTAATVQCSLAQWWRV